MKFKKPSQLVVAAAASLCAATLVTACSQIDETLTVDFVFVASAKAAGANSYGLIDVYEINSESGKMRRIPASPFPSGGRNPVSEAVSADNGSLFVANQYDDNIVQFVIGSDGKLYAFNTVNTPGIFPVAIAANKSNLFVIDTYQPLAICSTADPCSGSIGVFPLSAGTSTTPAAIGAPVVNPAVDDAYWPLAVPCNPTDIITPTAINVLATGTYVYVTANDTTAAADDTAGTFNPCDQTASTSSAPTGYVFGFQVGSGGALTALPDSPYPAGTQPSSIASTSTGGYVYITDFGKADVLGYSVGSNGALTALSGSPFAAGNQPSAIVVDPAYPYAYVVNSLDSTVEAYSIVNGQLTYLGGASSPVLYGTGSQPVAIGIDPSTERFVYIANFLSNTVSGFELSPSAGTLVESQFSPFTSDDLPTAVAAIPHNGTGGGVEPQ